MSGAASERTGREIARSLLTSLGVSIFQAGLISRAALLVKVTATIARGPRHNF
jgi:hypothetical protein